MREKLDFIYYRFYRFLRYTGNTSPAISTFGFLGIFLMLNFASLFSLIYAFKGLNPSGNDMKYAGFIVPIAILTILYFLFGYDKRYREIISRNEKEAKSKLRKGNIYIIIYLVLSLAVWVLEMYAMGVRNEGFL